MFRDGRDRSENPARQDFFLSLYTVQMIAKLVFVMMSSVKTYKTELKDVLDSLFICMFCPNSALRIAVSQLSIIRSWERKAYRHVRQIPQFKIMQKAELCLLCETGIEIFMQMNYNYCIKTENLCKYFRNICTKCQRWERRSIGYGRYEK